MRFPAWALLLGSVARAQSSSLDLRGIYVYSNDVSQLSDPTVKAASSSLKFLRAPENVGLRAAKPQRRRGFRGDVTLDDVVVQNNVAQGGDAAVPSTPVTTRAGQGPKPPCRGRSNHLDLTPDAAATVQPAEH